MHDSTVRRGIVAVPRKARTPARQPLDFLCAHPLTRGPLPSRQQLRRDHPPICSQHYQAWPPCSRCSRTSYTCGISTSTDTTPLPVPLFSSRTLARHSNPRARLLLSRALSPLRRHLLIYTRLRHPPRLLGHRPRQPGRASQALHKPNSFNDLPSNQFKNAYLGVK